MIIPNIWKNKNHVHPKSQPDILLLLLLLYHYIYILLYIVNQTNVISSFSPGFQGAPGPLAHHPGSKKLGKDETSFQTSSVGVPRHSMTWPELTWKRCKHGDTTLISWRFHGDFMVFNGDLMVI